jgi:hypothetical protein
MTGNGKGEAFVKLPRELIESAAWRALGINARRFLDFLLIEHMNHGGKANGKLLAPRRQLEQFGIGSHFISSAIDDCERAQLVDCRRGVGRQPSVYSLTWLPLSDGSEPSNRWRAYQVEIIGKSGVVTAKQHSLHMTAKQQSFTVEIAVTKPLATAKQQSQSPESSSAKQHYLSRKLLTTAKPKGCGESDGCVSEPSGSPSEVPAADGQAPQTADQSVSGKPNGKDHDMTAQREIAAVVPLRVQHGKEVSK